MKKITLTAMMIALVISMAPATEVAARNHKKQSAIANTSSAIQMKHVGSDDEYVYLQIDVTQPENQSAVLEITDARGEKLYSERLNQATHTRLVKVDPSELSDIKLKLKTPGGIAEKTYTLNVSNLSVFSLDEVKK